MDGPEQALYDNVFSELTPGEFRRLVKLGEWREIEAGTLIVKCDSVVHDIQVLEASGALRSTVEMAEIIARNEPGQFVGEMSFLSGERATADVIAS